MVKKHDIIEGTIEDIKFPNKGITYIDGKKVEIRNTLIGQKVRARVVKKKGKRIKAKLLEVIRKSPVEREAECEHFGVCGGCSYLHLPYDDQLKMKSNQVNKLLNRAGIDGYEFLGIESSPTEYQYRNKMEFTFGDIEKGGDLALGMHKQQKYYEMVVVDGCKIVDSDFSKVLMNVLEYCREKDLPFYHKKTHKGYLRNLVVRRATKTGELLINLVTSSQLNIDLTELIKRIKSIEYNGELVGFLHTINDGVADVVKSDETRILFGRDYIFEELLRLKFKISAFSFFQTNSLGAEKLYSIVREFAGETNNKTIFDLYCGTGTIAQIMAPVAEKVIGIEIVKEAVDSAKENAQLNGLDNCEFITGDVLEKIDEIEEKPDLIILDPPRSGVHKKALKKIINFDCPEIIYVSCKPTSLAEDLKVLKESGYQVKKVKCMDMFPQTPHVEAVTLLTK